MVRYAKQRNRSNCGPTVLINAVKWAGKDISYKEHIKNFSKHCGHDPKIGTWPPMLDYTVSIMSEINLIERIKKPTLKDLDYHLDKGRAIILSYKHYFGGHFVLVTGRTKKYFYVVNDTFDGPALRRRSRSGLSKDINYKYSDDIGYCELHSYAWVIESSLKEENNEI